MLVEIVSLYNGYGMDDTLLLADYVFLQASNTDIEYIARQNAIMKAGKILDVGTTDELVKQVRGKVWTCVVPPEKIPMYEMKLSIINQRSENNNQVSIRYLADEAKTSDSVMASPRLEDLYLWLFPQVDIREEGK